MFSFLPLLPIFILYVLSELLGSNYFLKKISIHVWGSECSPMDDIRTSPKPLFYRLSLAWPEPILLAGFVLYTVSTSPFLMLTPNLPLSIILFCFFLLKWSHPLPEYFWAFSPLKVSWPLCFWPSWAFCERSLREWGYGSRELTVALWGQNLRDHNWFSQGDQMASPAASLASRSREVSYLLTMPPWASFPVWVSLSTSVKWAWWTYFTVLLWGSHEMPALTLFLAPKRCSVHDSFLPSLTKDLFCAHTWAAPCFEGGQRWGPVLRKLIILLGDNCYPVWNNHETIWGSGWGRKCFYSCLKPSSGLILLKNGRREHLGTNFCGTSLACLQGPIHSWLAFLIWLTHCNLWIMNTECRGTCHSILRR